LKQEYARAAAFEKTIQRAGFVDEHVQTPRCHERVLQARDAAQRIAACRLTQRPGEEDDDDDLDEDSGVEVIAELPPGVPAWTPKPFLARNNFTKGWQKWLLRQDEPSHPDGDGRIAEGVAMSVIMLWLDFATLADKLANEASQCQGHEIADALRTESSANMAAAYEAGRMRVDGISMSLLK
jgi:hypothetical protein